jgi:hypothetical protein
MATPSEESNKAKDSLNEIKALTDVISGGFNNIADSIKNLVDDLANAKKELSLFNNVTNDITRTLKKVSDINEDLIKNQIKLNQGKLTSKEVDEQINKAVATRQVLESRLLKLQNTLNEEGEISVEQQQEILHLQTQIAKISNEVLVNFQEQRKAAKDTSGIFGELNKRSSDYVKELTSASFIVDFLFKQFQRVDGAVGQLAKDFNMSYSEALKTRQELTQIASLSGNAAINTRGLQESMVAIGQSLGSNAKLNKEDLETFTELREVAGYTNEELIGIQKLTLATGGNLKDNTKQFLGTVAALNAQNKLTINEKQLLKEVANTSAAIKLSIGGTTAELAKSAFQAKQFGINLDQADDIANSLLDFEASITAELEAELLTGKNLNLERARLLALNGDIAGASAEILSQIQGSAEFTKMNRIQQEAFAKAVGMTREDLAASLIEREALQKIGVADAEAAAKKYATLRQTMSAEEAAKALGDEQYAKQLESQSIQEKFNQAMEKLQDIIGNLVNGPFGAFLEGLSKGLDYVGKIFSYFGQIGATIKGFFGDKVGGFLGDIASVATIGALIALIGSSMLKGTIFNPMIVKDISFGGGMMGGAGGAGGAGAGIGAGLMSAFGQTKGAGFLSNFKGAAGSKLLIGGGILSGLFSAFGEYSENKEAGMSTGENLARSGLKGTGAGLGAWGGAAGGAAIGTMIFPGVGTAIGGLLGGILGAMGGGALGEGAGDLAYGDEPKIDVKKEGEFEDPYAGRNSPLVEEMKALRQAYSEASNKPIIIENKMDSTTFGTAIAKNTYAVQ